LSKILECVPNFSEGQSPKVIEAIADAVRKVPHVKLLDIDPGYHANRTVYTFAGEPNAVCEAAFRMQEVASKLIDMQAHKGEHPRIGAMDVCPLIPISNMEMYEAVELSNFLGQRVANELGIPVYLYENSAIVPERKNLAWLRSGEYEGLNAKIKEANFKPDFGQSDFNPQSGISIIGARDFLVAFNINLDTKDVNIAKEIAAQIRESGKNGIPGAWQKVKAIGWYIREFDKVQISMNLTDYKTTPVWKVFEEVHQSALDKGVNVTGSELVGMIPLKAIAECGEFFLKKNGQHHHHMSHSELVAYAVKYLGLDEVKPFDSQKKVIEFAINNS
jgi:glutamate formiminotransferase/formiminotetrahydrofolate cyclodeaminase